MTKEHYLRLVERTRSGETAAADELAHVLSVRLLTIAKHKVGDWSEADRKDLIQSTLTVFLEKIHEIRDNPCGFAVRILHNQVGNAMRRRRAHFDRTVAYDQLAEGTAFQGANMVRPSSELPNTESVEHRLEQQDEFLRVVQAIDRLKPFCRAFFKAIIEEMSIGEIWNHFQHVEPQLSRSAFDKRVFDCRRQLKRMVKAYS